MINIVVLGFETSLASPLVAVADTFRLSSQFCQNIFGQKSAVEFNVKIATHDGSPVRCANRMRIEAHCSLSELNHPIDVLVIPTVCANYEKNNPKYSAYLQTIKQYHETGSLIVANDYSVPYVAELGILDGKLATTHWSIIDRFREWFPQVNLKPEQMTTFDNNIYCCAGGFTWNDLLFEVMCRFSDEDTTIKSKKIVYVGRERPHNRQSSMLNQGKKYHEDEVILKIQEWLEQHFAENICFNEVAKQFNMSCRNFYRRFRIATGESPNDYLKSIRLQVAKELLENTSHRIDHITKSVGYDDNSSFTKMFKRWSGLSPKQYRDRYHL